jgi:hypothetical protein
MSVIASFEPGRIASEPGVAAALTLRLHNDESTNEVVRLRAAGVLAAQTVVQSETVYLDAEETFDVSVIVDVSTALPAGPHSSTIEVLDSQGLIKVTAEATIDVVEVMGYAVNMVPEHSRSATAGRHKVTIHNTGNTPVIVELLPETSDNITLELATPVVSVIPGETAKVDLRVIPPDRFWSGPKRGFGFTIHAVTNDGVTQDFHGTFEQGPRLRPWLVPALVGAAIALLLGALAWFALLKPYVDQTAEDAAEQAILDDRAALRDRIDELEAIAAEANELPLGEPADIRLEATAPPGGSSSDAFAVSNDRVLSVTDVLFQNPTGAVGRVSLLRDGVVLIESQLANFRDLDFHFVAPFQFDGGSTIELVVVCTAPGPNETDCPAAATINGFVDQSR